jgi:nucleoside phosphorylase
MLNILLVVPLAEEFSEIRKTFVITKHEVKEGEFLYIVEPPRSGITITVVVLGDSGPTPAAQRAERLIRLVNPSLIVVIGLAGSLSDDVRLMDVVVAEEIDHYLANSKTKPSKDGGFALLMSGRHNRTSHSILQVVRNFEFASPGIYNEWQSECLTRTTATTAPKHKLGHLACGDSVSDSKEFKDFLLAHSDRKYVAIEMESSGVAEAAAARTTPIPLLILRGISDNAEGKVELDSTSKGAYRTAAVGNAASFLHCLLRWPELHTMMTKPVHAETPTHEIHLKEVIEFIKSHK